MIDWLAGWKVYQTHRFGWMDWIRKLEYMVGWIGCESWIIWLAAVEMNKVKDN